MEYLRGWRAMRQDPQWTNKVLIASVLALSAMCIPVFGQLVLTGWAALMLRRAVSGQDSPLPRMDFDFDYFMKLLNGENAMLGPSGSSTSSRNPPSAAECAAVEAALGRASAIN